MGPLGETLRNLLVDLAPSLSVTYLPLILSGWKFLLLPFLAASRCLSPVMARTSAPRGSCWRWSHLAASPGLLGHGLQAASPPRPCHHLGAVVSVGQHSGLLDLLDFRGMLWTLSIPGQNALSLCDCDISAILPSMEATPRHQERDPLDSD